MCSVNEHEMFRGLQGIGLGAMLLSKFFEYVINATIEIHAQKRCKDLKKIFLLGVNSFEMWVMQILRHILVKIDTLIEQLGFFLGNQTN